MELFVICGVSLSKNDKEKIIFLIMVTMEATICELEKSK